MTVWQIAGQLKSPLVFTCECHFLMCSHGVLASSMVDQFTKGQLSFDFWVFTELVLALNQKKSARKRMQEIVEIS